MSSMPLSPPLDSFSVPSSLLDIQDLLVSQVSLPFGVSKLAFLLASQSHGHCLNGYIPCPYLQLTLFYSYDHSLLAHHLSYPQAPPRKAALSITTDPASHVLK